MVLRHSRPGSSLDRRPCTRRRNTVLYTHLPNARAITHAQRYKEMSTGSRAFKHTCAHRPPPRSLPPCTPGREPPGASASGHAHPCGAAVSWHRHSLVGTIGLRMYSGYSIFSIITNSTKGAEAGLLMHHTWCNKWAELIMSHAHRNLGGEGCSAWLPCWPCGQHDHDSWSSRAKLSPMQ
jgi:hypothetical protein